jgi:PKD repeat protein
MTTRLGFAPYYTTLAVYTGAALDSLSLVGCRDMWTPLTFSAEAGTTYYFQVAISFGGTGSLQFRLEEAAPPQASFGYFPGAPSSLDTVQFFDFSYDPAGLGIQTQSWDFGDGATATGCCPTHRYTADGDYVIQLTVTTFDGRTATTTQAVQVRTHDVAITKFQVPNSAKAGQTRQIVVGLRNYNQPETVRIELYRSTPAGFQIIGYLDQFVPVRSGNRTTDFQFSYTFTAGDAAMGKVNFRAVAIIQGAVDSLPTDNEAISLPTKVSN